MMLMLVTSQIFNLFCYGEKEDSPSLLFFPGFNMHFGGNCSGSICSIFYALMKSKHYIQAYIYIQIYTVVVLGIPRLVLWVVWTLLLCCFPLFNLIGFYSLMYDVGCGTQTNYTKLPRAKMFYSFTWHSSKPTKQWPWTIEDAFLLWKDVGFSIKTHVCWKNKITFCETKNIVPSLQEGTNICWKEKASSEQAVWGESSDDSRQKHIFFCGRFVCFRVFFSPAFFFCGGEVGKNARGTVPSWELFIYAIPMATFESMIFLFPRWDMLCYFSGEHHLVMTQVVVDLWSLRKSSITAKNQ